jgi:hypothetical protein
MVGERGGGSLANDARLFAPWAFRAIARIERGASLRETHRVLRVRTQRTEESDRAARLGRDATKGEDTVDQVRRRPVGGTNEVQCPAAPAVDCRVGRQESA